MDSKDTTTEDDSSATSSTAARIPIAGCHYGVSDGCGIVRWWNGRRGWIAFGSEQWNDLIGNVDGRTSRRDARSTNVAIVVDDDIRTNQSGIYIVRHIQ